MDNYRILISHGATNIESVSTFKCPSNVECIFFERPGKTFNKLDSSLITNLVLSKLRSGHDLKMMLNRVIYVPRIGGGSYLSRSYKDSDEVPNITLNMKDSKIQCGLFNATSKKYGTFNFSITPFNYNAKKGGDISSHVCISSKMSLLSTDIEHLGVIVNGLYVYKNYKRTLQSVMSNISNMNKGSKITMFVITCRTFTSTLVDSTIEEQMFKLNTRIKVRDSMKYHTHATEQKFIDAERDVNEMKNLLSLTQGLSSHIFSYFNSNSKIFDEDLRGLERFSLYRNDDDLIQALTGYKNKDIPKAIVYKMKKIYGYRDMFLNLSMQYKLKE
jgi:hypothetical protein